LKVVEGRESRGRTFSVQKEKYEKKKKSGGLLPERQRGNRTGAESFLRSGREETGGPEREAIETLGVSEIFFEKTALRGGK